MPRRVELSRTAGADRWRIEPVGAMSVPGIVFASEALLPQVAEDQALQQVVNVATLPGIVEASYAMPDVHWGYGFPIGGVAATDVDRGGVISPGGVGFDISCGVRLLVSPISVDELAPQARGADGYPRRRHSPRARRRGRMAAARRARHSRRCCEKALGRRSTLDSAPRPISPVARTAAPSPVRIPPQVSERAVARGLHQVGSLGSGNHFLEIQAVDQIYDADTAEAFGLAPSQVCVMIHCGSRGLGHQICSDHVRTMLEAMPRYGISVPDPQLACVPVRSAEGQAYLGAMAAAANYGRANRQVAVGRRAPGIRRRRSGPGTWRCSMTSRTTWPSSNTTRSAARRRLLCVHRKGATLRLPPGHPDLPEDLRAVGQPVLVPGSMGTASYVLVGVDPGGAFSSTCHGAGRTMSRHAAARQVRRQRAPAPARVAGHRRAGQIGSGPGRGGANGLQGRRRGRGHLRTGRARPAGRPAAAPWRGEGLAVGRSRARARALVEGT